MKLRRIFEQKNCEDNQVDKKMTALTRISEDAIRSKQQRQDWTKVKMLSFVKKTRSSSGICWRLFPWRYGCYHGGTAIAFHWKATNFQNRQDSLEMLLLQPISSLMTEQWVVVEEFWDNKPCSEDLMTSQFVPPIEIPVQNSPVI